MVYSAGLEHQLGSNILRGSNPLPSAIRQAHGRPVLFPNTSLSNVLSEVEGQKEFAGFMAASKLQ